MTYCTNIETRSGTVLICLSDAQIDGMPADSETKRLRDMRRSGTTDDGRYVTTEDICNAWFDERYQVSFRYSREAGGMVEVKS